MDSININKTDNELFQVFIHIDEKTKAKAEEKSIHKIQSKKRINGFRKGKIPPYIIKSKFMEEVARETMNELLNHYWDDIRKKLKSDVHKILSIDKFERNELEFTCISKPYLELCKLNEARVEHYEPIIHGKDIEDVIEEEKVLMVMGDKPQKKSDNNYERLDCLDLELYWKSGSDENIKTPETIKERLSTILGRTRNIEELDDFILSKKPAVNTEFKIPTTRDGFKGELVCKILSVAKFKYPPVDDKFAMNSHLKVKKIHEYKKLVRENLVKKMKSNIFRKQLVKIMAQYKEKSKIFVSDAYLESIVDKFFQENPNYKEKAATKQEDREQLKSVFRENTENSLIYNAIAQMARESADNFALVPSRFEDFFELGPVITNRLYIIVDKMSKKRELSLQESKIFNLLQETYELNIMRDFLEKKGVLQKPRKNNI